MSEFKLDFDELSKIDGVPKDNLTFQINIDDLEVDWDDELGSGSFAQVFRGWYLWTEVAVKKMILPVEERDRTLIKYFKREVILLNLVKHPNIVQFLGWSHPEDSNYLLIVEEFIKGGTLQNFLKNKCPKDSWSVKIQLCMDVAKAMLYLHKHKVVYRDLKCDNILIDDSMKPRYAKLVDFGFARTFEMETQRKGPPMTICGTDDWMAPEVILGMDYDERSDVFSFGVVLLECLLGTENVQNKLARKAFNCFELDTALARSLTPATCPEELLELTLSCCAYEPNARPDFHEILTILTNAFRHSSSNDSGALSDVSATGTDSSPAPSRVRGEVSALSDDEDETSSGTPSNTGSHGSDKAIDSPKSESTTPHSTALTSALLSASPAVTSALASSGLSPAPSPSPSPILVPSLGKTSKENTTRHRNSMDSAADDEAEKEDLRRRISQTSLFAPKNSDGSPRQSSPRQASPRSVSFSHNLLETSRDDLRISMSNLSAAGFIEKKELYIRVESLVDDFTVWNVRVNQNATVADVCENLAKKIDAKYKYVELYQLHKKKRVSLFPEQFIEHIRGHWGGDPEYKFGVLYRTKEGGNEFRASTSRRNSISKNSPFGKLSKKDTFSTKKNGHDKKKTVAMNVNFSMNPS